MKPCLKHSNSPTPLLCTHRKCVAFGAQVSEEVHIADEWDRTPTEPTRRLTYQDILELKEIQRSLPHASQPCDIMGGRQFLSQVPIALVPLLPDPMPCSHHPLHLLDTPPSSCSSSPPLPPTSPPTPSLSHTSLDSSPHSSPDPCLPLLLLDDPDPHPLFPTTRPTKQKRKRYIIVNDIEMEMDDDSDSDSDLDPAHPFKRGPATPPPSPTQEQDLDLDPPHSTLFSPVPSLLLSHTHPDPPSRLPSPPSPSPSTATARTPPPPTPKPIPKPTSSPPPPINLHMPIRFKRPGSCLMSPGVRGTGPPALAHHGMTMRAEGKCV